MAPQLFLLHLFGVEGMSVIQTQHLNYRFDIKVKVYTEAGTWDFSDFLTHLVIEEGEHLLTSFVVLEFYGPLEKFYKAKVFKYDEIYEVEVKLFNDQHQLVDKFKYKLFPKKYDTDLFNHVPKEKATSDENMTKYAVVKHTVFCMPYGADGYWACFAKIYEKKKYKEIFQDFIFSELKKYLKLNQKEIDKERKNNQKWEQFFIPWCQIKNAIAFVLQAGYGDKSPYTYYYDNTGFRLYNIKDRYKKKKKKIYLYPIYQSQWADFKEMFITDFSIETNPDFKLMFGGKKKEPFKWIGYSRFKEATTKVKNIDYLKGEKYFKKIYTKAQYPKCITRHYFYKDINLWADLKNVRMQFVKLNVTANRWKKFEDLKPYKYIWQVKFTNEKLKDFDGDYVIAGLRLTLDRRHQQTLPRLDLTFKRAIK